MFQIFLWKIIFSLLNYPFNNNIVILESKIKYFFLRSNFRYRTTLKEFLDLILKALKHNISIKRENVAFFENPRVALLSK